MKRKILFVTIGAVALVLVTAFWAGKAFATTGCFSDTNGHWAETFICWLKDNGVSTGYVDGTYRPENYITRAEMAKMLQKQAEVPPSTGLIMITPGNGEWLKRSATDDLSFDNLGYSTDITKATAGVAWITIQPSIPTVLYGRRMQLVGVDFCYQATANATLLGVDLDTFTSDAGDTGGYTWRAGDGTDRTDSACRYYALTTPYTLTKFDGVVFYAAVQWNVAGANFRVTRTTFVLQPSETLTTPFTP